MFILTDRPEGSCFPALPGYSLGTPLTDAFDAIDRVYNIEPFTKEQAIAAITTNTASNNDEARTLFHELADGGHISEA